MATAKQLLLWSVLVAAIVITVRYMSSYGAASAGLWALCEPVLRVFGDFSFFFFSFLEISMAHIQEGSNFNSEIHQVHLAKTVLSVILCNQLSVGRR